MCDAEGGGHLCETILDAFEFVRYPRRSAVLGKKMTDANHEALDGALLAYLSAYEEYTTLHVEMEAQLKDGFFNLSRARRDLSRSSTVLGQELFPKEIEPLIVLAEEPGDAEGDARQLRYEFCEEGALVTGRDDVDDQDAPEGGTEPENDENEAAIMEALARMGLSPEMQREIAAAVRDDGDEVGVAVGDTIVIDGPSGGVAKVQTRAPVSLSPSNLNDLKRAQFRAALDADEAYTASRPKALKPNAKRDPSRWFTLLPPPSLRQGQKSFRRAIETTAALATAQARMHVARERFETLQEQLVETWPLVE